MEIRSPQKEYSRKCRTRGHVISRNGRLEISLGDYGSRRFIRQLPRNCNRRADVSRWRKLGLFIEIGSMTNAPCRIICGTANKPPAASSPGCVRAGAHAHAQSTRARTVHRVRKPTDSAAYGTSTCPSKRDKAAGSSLTKRLIQGTTFITGGSEDRRSLLASSRNCARATERAAKRVSRTRARARVLYYLRKWGNAPAGRVGASKRPREEVKARRP